jgi:uncharacterized membrane protein YuzA (DUF378 family)
LQRTLVSLLFLVLYGTGAFFSHRSQIWTLEEVGGRRRSTLLKSAVGTAVLLLAFVQFWLLTGVFPTSLILVLIGASFVSGIVYACIGAAGGLTLPEKRHKIGALW